MFDSASNPNNALGTLNMDTSTDQSKTELDMHLKGAKLKDVSPKSTHGKCIKYWNLRYATSTCISDQGLDGSVLVYIQLISACIAQNTVEMPTFHKCFPFMKPLVFAKIKQHKNYNQNTNRT